jgi:hypothetical protein
MSSLVVSLSSAAELLEGCIDVAAANKDLWGTRLALATALLHLLELGTKLVLLGSEHNADLMED